jgi:excisionase family DNA binding protein
MRQSRTPRNRTNRRQTIQNRAANRAANRHATVEVAVPVAEAARLLGVDARTVRRMCAERRLKSFVTPGGHRRVALADIEAIRNGNTDLKRSSFGHVPSPTLQQKKERLEELNLTIQEKKAKIALQQLEDEERDRAEHEEVERRAQEQEARRIRQDGEIEKSLRKRERKQARSEARAAQARHEWEAQWLRDMLRELPRDVPSELRLKVAEVFRQELSDLYQTSADHAEDLVYATLRAAGEMTLSPWRRRNQMEKAANDALNELPLFARGSWGQASEWERRLREQALAVISALPDTAMFEQMSAAARTVGQEVAGEYEHEERCASAMADARRSLNGMLPFTSSQTRVKAEEAVRAAFAGLSVGASSAEFDSARDAAMEPFSASAAQGRAEHEARQARARLEAEAEKHLDRVFYYLADLQADPDGWDFEGKLYQYSKQITQEIKLDLIEELPLDFLAGRRRVEQLVDKWLAAHWKAPDATMA